MNRREFNKTLIGTGAGLALWTGSAHSQPERRVSDDHLTNNRMNSPNFVVFLTDDHGHWTLPCYGNREVLSPTLDSLATESAVFDRAYCPSPVCSPARACFWTGRFPSAHGIHDWLPEARDKGQFPAISHMPGNIVSQLQSVGYEVGGCGKYHCGRPTSNPLGADYWFVQVPHIEYANRARQKWWDNGKTVTLEAYQTAVITDAAIRFLRQRDRDRPFFLFVGHVNTHTPHSDEARRHTALYEKAEFSDVPIESFSEAHGRHRFVFRSEKERIEKLVQYYASVTALDEQVGRVLDELDATGDLAETHVIYTSDHGHMNGQHGLHTKGNATVPVNFLEESIRVPLLWRTPDSLAPRRFDHMVDHCDLHASILDLAGASVVGETSDGAHLPGHSYAAALYDQPYDAKPVQFAEYGNARMARTNSTKLIRRYPGPNGQFPDECYDLQADPRERTNVLESMRETPNLADLDRALDAHFARYTHPDHDGRRMDLLENVHKSSCWNIDPENFPVIYQ